MKSIHFLLQNPEPIDKRFFFYYNKIIKISTILKHNQVTHDSMTHNIVLQFLCFWKGVNIWKSNQKTN